MIFKLFIVIVIVAVVQLAPIGQPAGSGGALVDAADDLEADLAALATSMETVGALSGQIRVTRAAPAADRLVGLGAERTMKELAAAIAAAQDEREFRKSRRAKIKSDLVALGNGLIAVGRDLGAVGGDFAGIGVALGPVGAQLAQRGAEMWSPRFRCKEYPLGPSVTSLGQSVQAGGTGFVTLGNSVSNAATVLGAVGQDLVALGADLDKGGQPLAELRARLDKLTADLAGLGPATTDLGHGVGALANGFAVVANALAGVGKQTHAFVNCRNRETNVMQRLRATANSIDAKAVSIGTSAQELHQTALRLIAKGGEMSTAGQGLGGGRDPGNFEQFIENFSLCAEWGATVPEFTRFPMQMDTHAGYAYFPFRQPEGREIALRVEGHYPFAAFGNFTTYRGSTGALHASLVDKDIKARPLSTNPFIAGNLVHPARREYFVTALPFASPFLGQLPHATIEFADDPGEGKALLVYRVYEEEPGQNGFGGELPFIRALDAKNLDRRVVCPFKALPIPEIDTSLAFQSPPPGADNKIYFYRSPRASTPLPDGDSGDSCTTYLNATLDAAKISVFWLPKLPTTFDNGAITATSTMPVTDARFVSFGVTGATNNYQKSTVTVSYPSQKTYTMYGNISGREIKTRPDGSAYFAVISPTLSDLELSLALQRATALGYNLLSLPAANDKVDPFVVYRMKVPAQGFQGATKNAPCHEGDMSVITPQFAASPATMGQYAPTGLQCDVTAFIEGGCGGAGHTPVIDGSYPAEVRFVDHLYRDTLGRAARTNELGHWLTVYKSQGRAAVAQGIVKSQERKDVLVNGLFQTFLGRGAGYGNAWTAHYGPAYDHLNITVGIAGSGEAFNRSGANCQTHTDRLYRALLDRPADPGALSAWGHHCQVHGPAAIAHGIAFSAEAAHVTTRRLYQQYLKRLPDGPGLGHYVNLLQSGATIDTATLSFVQSDEYFYRP